MDKVKTVRMVRNISFGVVVISAIWLVLVVSRAQAAGTWQPQTLGLDVMVPFVVGSASTLLYGLMLVYEEAQQFNWKFAIVSFIGLVLLQIIIFWLRGQLG